MFIVEFSSLIKGAVGWERFLCPPVVHKLEAHLIYRSGTKWWGSAALLPTLPA